MNLLTDGGDQANPGAVSDKSQLHDDQLSQQFQESDQQQVGDAATGAVDGLKENTADILPQLGDMVQKQEEPISVNPSNVEVIAYILSTTCRWWGFNVLFPDTACPILFVWLVNTMSRTSKDWRLSCSKTKDMFCFQEILGGQDEPLFGIKQQAANDEEVHLRCRCS